VKKRPGTISLSGIRNILFWTSCLLYFRFAVIPPLIAELQEPVFLFGRPFLDGIFFHPGGFAEYISLFLTRCLEYPWPGALILTAIAGCFSLAWLFAAIRTTGGKNHTGLPALLLAALLAGLHGHYTFSIATDIGLILAFGSIGIILLTVRGREWLACLMTLIFSPVLYWLAGGPFLILLAWIWVRAILYRGIRLPVRMAAVLGFPLIGWFLPRFSTPQ
jgi:hypothetical protein